MPILSACFLSMVSVSVPQDGLIGPTFPGARYPVGDSDAIPATGDIDGDGHEDLVVLSASFLQPGLSILFGKGDGSFEPPLRIALHAYPTGLAMGDIDSDGDLDFAYATEFALGFRILRNIGERQFMSSSVSFLNGLTGQVDLIDVDLNGTLDLVISQGLAPWVDVSLNTGPGNFIFPIRSHLDQTFGRADLGDVNSDGIPDLLLTGRSRDEVDIALGNGLGSFSNTISYPMGEGTLSGILRDTDSDGVLDVVAVEEDDGTISVRRGLGDGTFGARFSRYVADSIGFVEVTQPGLDAQVDFVVTLAESPSFPLSRPGIGVVEGDSGLPTGPQVVFQEGVRPEGIGVADFDKDGLSDFVIVDEFVEEVSIYLGKADGVIELPTQLPLGIAAGDLHLADVNGDGFLDVFGATEALESWVLLGDDMGEFPLPPILSDTGFPANGSLSDDFDADGIPDLLLFNEQGADARAQIYLGDGAGGFTAGEVLDGVTGSKRRCAISDVNGDGVLDVVGPRSGRGYATFLGAGDGTFTLLPASNDETPTRDASVVDVNGDGSVDLLRLGIFGLLQVHLGDGTGSFTEGFAIAFNPDAVSLNLGDLNGDGRVDAVVGVGQGFSSPVNAIQTALGVGDGTFVLTGEQEIEGRPSRVQLVDLDMDGLDDVVATRPLGTSSVAHLRSLGNGQLDAPEYFDVLVGRSCLEVGDVNGDGNPDLVTAEAISGNLSVHLNRADVRLATFCDAAPNSTGAPATLTSEGSRSFALDEFQVQVRSVPAHEVVTWFSGGLPGGRTLPGGMLCIDGPLLRNSQPMSSGALGQSTLNGDFAASGLQPGTTRYFQCWYTDAAGPARQFNFSNALAVLVAP